MATRLRSRNVEKELLALDGKLKGILRDRFEVDRQITEAKATLEAFGEAFERARADEHLGREGDTETIREKASLAKASIPGLELKRKALERARQEIEESVQDLESTPECLAWLTAEREKLSKQVDERRPLLEADRELFGQEWRDCYDLNQRIQRAYKRAGREEEQPREMPWPEIQPLIGFGIGHLHPYPGGKRPEEG